MDIRTSMLAVDYNGKLVISGTFDTLIAHERKLKSPILYPVSN